MLSFLVKRTSFFSNQAGLPHPPSLPMSAAQSKPSFPPKLPSQLSSSGPKSHVPSSVRLTIQQPSSQLIETSDSPKSQTLAEQIRASKAFKNAFKCKKDLGFNTDYGSDASDSTFK